MNLKFITVLISTFFLSFSLKADNELENPSPHQKTETLQEASAKEGLNRLQAIHHFSSTFDDCQFGGIPYGSFK